MAIHLKRSDLDAIRRHGEETFPHECCGFMLGKTRDTSKTVSVLERAENTRSEEDQRQRFLINPDAILRMEKQARERGLDIIGFYHSHPNAEAKPSAYDREHAWLVYSYIIVSINDGSAGSATSWVLESDGADFCEEQILIE